MNDEDKVAVLEIDNEASSIDIKLVMEFQEGINVLKISLAKKFTIVLNNWKLQLYDGATKINADDLTIKRGTTDFKGIFASGKDKTDKKYWSTWDEFVTLLKNENVKVRLFLGEEQEFIPLNYITVSKSITAVSNSKTLSLDYTYNVNWYNEEIIDYINNITPKFQFHYSNKHIYVQYPNNKWISKVDSINYNVKAEIISIFKDEKILTDVIYNKSTFATPNGSTSLTNLLTISSGDNNLKTLDKFSLKISVKLTFTYYTIG